MRSHIFILSQGRAAAACRGVLTWRGHYDYLEDVGGLLPAPERPLLFPLGTHGFPAFLVVVIRAGIRLLRHPDCGSALGVVVLRQ